MNGRGQESHTYGDTIPAPPPCADCARMDARLALASQTIAQLQHELDSLRAIIRRPLPDGM